MKRSLTLIAAGLVLALGLTGCVTVQAPVEPEPVTTVQPKTQPDEPITPEPVEPESEPGADSREGDAIFIPMYVETFGTTPSTAVVEASRRVGDTASEAYASGMSIEEIDTAIMAACEEQTTITYDDCIAASALGILAYGSPELVDAFIAAAS